MKKKFLVWNVPNVLTMIRMGLIPVYWVLFLKNYRMEALAVYILASSTDVVDGYIARKYNKITDFGKLMDPLADKLMVVSVMLSMVLKGMIPTAALVILGIKEFLMLVGSAVMLKKGKVVFSKWIGKLAQLVVVTSLVLCFFGDYFTSAGFPIHLYMMWTGVGLTLCAMLYYLHHSILLLKEDEKQKA